MPELNTAPDLDRLIRVWRQSLQGLPQEERAEIEDHLRAAYERFDPASLTVEETFHVVADRFAKDPALLKEELASNHRSRLTHILARVAQHTVTLLLLAPILLIGFEFVNLARYDGIGTVFNPWAYRSQEYGIFIREVWIIALPVTLIGIWCLIPYLLLVAGWLWDKNKNARLRGTWV